MTDAPAIPVTAALLALTIRNKTGNRFHVVGEGDACRLYDQLNCLLSPKGETEVRLFLQGYLFSVFDLRDSGPKKIFNSTRKEG